MNRSSVIIFASGFALGAGACFLALKAYFKNEAEEEIADVRQAFEKQLSDVEQERDEALGMARSAIVHGENYVGSNEILSDKATTSGIISASTRRGKGEMVDYTRYFDSENEGGDEHEDWDDSEGESFALSEVDHSGDGPEDDDPDDYEDPDEPVLTSDGVLTYKNGDRVSIVDRKTKPKIIKAEDYGELSGYDCSNLYFYSGDGVLINEEGDIIDNPESLIGDALTKYGFKDNDEERIYVRDEHFTTDYEIVKVFRSYAD